MRIGLRIAIASLGLAGAGVGGGGSLEAQTSDALYARFNAVSGWETRGFTFDSGVGTRSVWQWNVPVVVVVPIGRKVSMDLTTHYASGRLETYSGSTQTLSGFTDTQIRLLYTMSRDRLIGSFSLNLPTGKRSLTASEFAVTGAVGSNYLSFPVSNSGTAFGATGGLAYARHAGAWNLGFSGSARYLGAYSPFFADTITYTPGLEARVRGGADRLLGQKSRLLLGFTVSTFSTDTYSASNTLVAGSYAPGTRFIGDLTLLRVIGRSTVTLAAWDLYRLAGAGSGGPNLDTKENVLNAELRFTHPIAPRLQIEPLVGFRQWNPSDYLGGRLESAGIAVRAGLTDHFSVAGTGRYDRGWIYDRATGRADLQGYGASVFLRFEQ